MTPQQIEALKLALEALDIAQGMLADLRSQHQPKMLSAYTALEEVLAEHAMCEVQRLGQEIEQKIGCVNHDCDQCKTQPEQEPVAWRDAAIRVGEDLSSVGPDGYYDMTAQQWLDWAMEQQPHGKNSLAQPEQEPVAWMDKYGEIYKDVPEVLSTDKPLYTSPPQRKPLTYKAIAQVIDPMPKKMKGFMVDWDFYDFARAIEAAHGIKGGA